MTDIAEAQERFSAALEEETRARDAAIKAVEEAMAAKCRLLDAWQRYDNARGISTNPFLIKEWLIMHARIQRCRIVIWRALYVSRLDRWGITCPW
jgi:hypothetical protein